MFVTMGTVTITIFRNSIARTDSLDTIHWWRLTLPSLFDLTGIRITPQLDTTLSGVTVSVGEVVVETVTNVVAGQIAHIEIGTALGQYFKCNNNI